MLSVKVGECLNPAIAMAQTTINMALLDEKYPGSQELHDLKKAVYKWLWCYMVIPFLAAAIAGAIVRFGHAKACKEF